MSFAYPPWKLGTTSYNRRRGSRFTLVVRYPKGKQSGAFGSPLGYTLTFNSSIHFIKLFWFGHPESLVSDSISMFKDHQVSDSDSRRDIKILLVTCPPKAFLSGYLSGWASPCKKVANHAWPNAVYGLSWKQARQRMAHIHGDIVLR